MLAQNLKRFDENRDGRLSEAEYRNAEAVLERERAAVTVADDALVKAVRAALAKVRGVDLPNTKVEVEQGVAAMIGIVEDAEVARQAQNLVKRIARRQENRQPPGVGSPDGVGLSGDARGNDGLLRPFARLLPGVHRCVANLHERLRTVCVVRENR